MAAEFNGSGTFVREHNWVDDRNANVRIVASRMDTEMDGIAVGLSQCITKDGQTTVTQNIPFNGKKLTGVGLATAGTDALSQNAGDARYIGQTVTATIDMNGFGIVMDGGNISTAGTISQTGDYTQLGAVATDINRYYDHSDSTNGFWWDRDLAGVIRMAGGVHTSGDYVIQNYPSGTLDGIAFRIARADGKITTADRIVAGADAVDDEDVVRKGQMDTAIAAIGGGAVAPTVQLFTATGSSTWTKPSGCIGIRATVVGPGGGGGGAAGGASAGAFGGGGGAGGDSRIWLDVTGISSLNVFVGTGGAGGVAGNNTGSAGSAATTLKNGATTIASGAAGGGGTGMASGTALARSRGGTGGSGSTGTRNAKGQDGSMGMRQNITQGITGGGGMSTFGAGPGDHFSGNAGSDAVSYGAGGEGAGATTSDNAGGDGADGAVLIEEFY